MFKDIEVLHMELSSRCSLSCYQCDRNQNGGAVNPHMVEEDLDIYNIITAFHEGFVQKLKRMYACGNLGDPITSKYCLDVFKYFRSANPNISLSMNTHGSARTAEWWTEMGRIIGDKGWVTFSIDGLEDTNHLYRQNANWDRIMKNTKAFIDAGGSARWDFIVFEHNEHQVEEARALAQEMGFAKFQVKKSGRFVTSKVEPKQVIDGKTRKGEEHIIAKTSKDEYRNKSTEKLNGLIEKYGSIDAYHDQTKISCKTADENSVYVSAEGLILPCCWTAGQLYKWYQKPRTAQIWELLDQAGGKDTLSIKHNSVDDILNGKFFTEILPQSWNKSSCNDGKLKVCATKCGKEFDPFADQFK